MIYFRKNSNELRNDMLSKVRLENFWIWTMKIGKILQKLYAEWSKVKNGEYFIYLVPKVQKTSP